MTKKDFELIASAIKDYINYSYDVEDTDNFIVHDYAERIAYKMADALASKNPRFNKDKFLQACGIETFDKDKFEKINGYKPSYNDKRWFEIRKQ